MLDLNSLRIFECVARQRSFSTAARTLGMPKSSVSRAIARLEADLGARLLQRTTREVVVTEAGSALCERCRTILGQLDDAIDYIGSLGAVPKGLLRVNAGTGFGLNVLSELLPQFLELYPDITIVLDLTSRPVDLIAGGIDVAIRVGPMPDSQLVSTRIVTSHRYLCAAPSYLARRGRPRSLDELAAHDTVEMPGHDGRPRSWVFSKPGAEPKKIQMQPRVSVNDPLTLHRLVVNGAGIGCISGYQCAPDIESGRLELLFADWTIPSIDLNVIFPSNRALSPAVRVFIDFIKNAAAQGKSWQKDPLAV